MLLLPDRKGKWSSMDRSWLMLLGMGMLGALSVATILAALSEDVRQLLEVERALIAQRVRIVALR